MNDKINNEINSLELDNKPAATNSLKDEFTPPPGRAFKPTTPLIEYFIVDDKDHTVFGKFDTMDAARLEAKQSSLVKKDLVKLFIIEFDGQVILDSEKLNIQYLDKVLKFKKGPDPEFLMFLTEQLASSLKGTK